MSRGSIMTRILCIMSSGSGGDQKESKFICGKWPRGLCLLMCKGSRGSSVMIIIAPSAIIAVKVLAMFVESARWHEQFGMSFRAILCLVSFLLQIFGSGCWRILILGRIPITIGHWLLAWPCPCFGEIEMNSYLKSRGKMWGVWYSKFRIQSTKLLLAEEQSWRLQGVFTTMQVRSL